MPNLKYRLELDVTQVTIGFDTVEWTCEPVDFDVVRNRDFNGETRIAEELARVGR